MAKDPAFLFYPNDFDAATKFFTNEQVGQYLRLLIAHFQHGRLSLKQMAFIVGSEPDPEILAKFKVDDLGKYYNERLEAEITKRKAFSESRRKNVQKRYNSATSVTTSIPTSEVRMENENININTSTIEAKNEIFKLSASGFMASTDHIGLPITEVQVQASIEYLHLTKSKKVSPEFIKKLWEVFKVKEFTGKKWYNDEKAVFTHFLNSLKYEKIDETKATTTPVKPNDRKALDILKLTD
jgi:uncharacterized protein YdaU (DUF1376 family)